MTHEGTDYQGQNMQISAAYQDSCQVKMTPYL